MYMIDLTAWCNGKRFYVNTQSVAGCSVRESVEVDKDSKVKGLDGQDKKTVKWYADIMLTNGIVISKEVENPEEGIMKLKEILDFNC